MLTIKQPFFNKLTLNLKSKIFSYLTYQQLTCIVTILEGHEQYQIVTKIVKNRIAFIGYLNRCDRSFYFGIYSLPLYQQYEEKNIQKIGLNNFQQNICEFPLKFNKSIKQCQNYVKQDIKQQFGKQLQTLFVDPCLPMPKLLRENAAGKVCSPFQNFLIARLETQNAYNDIYQPVFEQLQQNIQQNQQVFIHSLIGNYQKGNQLCNFPHLITYDNLSSKLIEQNQFHNLLVSLFGITELYLSAVQQVLKNIQDPFELLLELCARYGQFQSTVIGIEQNLGYLFKLYGDLYRQIYDNSEQLSFWRPAFIMWISKMNKFYQKTNKVYVQLIQEQSQQNLSKVLHNQRFAQISSNLKDSLLQENKNLVKNQSMLKSLIKQQGQLHTLLISYLEHLVDISTNQLNIFYSGYSEQQLDEPFMNLQIKLVQNQSRFIQDIQKLLDNSNKSQIKQIIEQKIENYIPFLKSRTIKQMEIQYNKQIHLNLEIKQISFNDKQVEHYLDYIKRTKPFLLDPVTSLSNYKLAFEQSDKSVFPETADSQKEAKSDGTFDFYYSDSETDEGKQKPKQSSSLRKQNSLEIQHHNKNEKYKGIKNVLKCIIIRTYSRIKSFITNNFL